MKVALVTYALNIGGVETFLRLLADFFQNNGHDVTFIETWRKGRWSDLFAGERYKVNQILASPFRPRYRHVKRIADELRGYDVI